MKQSQPPLHRAAPGQRGLALVFVLIMMSMATAIALIAARITLQSDRGARNDRDRAVAYQSAELALQDARDDIMSPRITGGRGCMFGTTMMAASEGCNGDPVSRGLCAEKPSLGDKPLYKDVDWEDTSNSRTYVTYGEFTNRAGSLQTNTFGAPAKPPKYIVVDETGSLQIFVPAIQAVLGQKDLANMRGYRVFALGYGPSASTQVMLESVIWKPQLSSQCRS